MEDCRRESNNKKNLHKLIDMSESTQVIDMLIKFPRFYFSTSYILQVERKCKTLRGTDFFIVVYNWVGFTFSLFSQTVVLASRIPNHVE